MRKSLRAAILAAALLAGSGASATPRQGMEMDARFVALDEIATPILSQSRIEGTLSVTLVLRATSVDTARTLRKRMPELRAASLAATMEFSRLYASGYTTIDVARLSGDLNAALKRVDPGVERVLIVSLSALPA